MLHRSMLGALVALTLLTVGVAATAQPGNALDFQGAQYVEVPDPIDLSGPITLEAWIKADAFDGGRIISNRDSGNGYEMDVIPSGFLRFTLNGTARGMCDISGHLGIWTHVAVTWAGPVDGAIVIYVDGEVAANDYWAGADETATGFFYIGQAAWGAYPFNGAIDEVRVFSTVVSPETIKVWSTRHIDAGHPDYASLEGAWNFEEGSGQVAANVTGDTSRDGQLGSTSGPDAEDPVWIVSGVVAVEPMTFGEVKALYR